MFYELLLESGFKVVIVDKIVECVKVSKVMIYKWWLNKVVVVMDGFFFVVVVRLFVFDIGLVLNDILIYVISLVNFLISWEGIIINELVGEG